METKANYMIVGGFVLAMIAAVFAVVLWLAKYHGQEDVTLYYIYFRGSVTGLQTGSAVRYRGVPVGTVRDIQIDSKNVELVEVTVAIRAGTPIKTDTVAQLQLQGITGLSFVQLSGGRRETSTLEPAAGKRRAVIQSIPSPIERVVEGAPELLMQLVMLANRASELLNDENQAKLNNILGNVDRLTAAFAADTDGLKRVVEATPGLFAQISALSERIAHILHDENQQRISGIIANADRLTASLAANSDALKNVVDAAPALLAQVSALATRLAATVDEPNQQKITSILANVDRLTGDPEGLKKAIDATPGALAEITALTARLRRALDDDNLQRLSGVLVNLDRATAVLADEKDGLKHLVADTMATLAVLRETGASVTKLANDISGTAGRLGAGADQALTTAAKLMSDIGSQAKRLIDSAEQALAGASRLTGDLGTTVGRISGGVDRTLGDVSSLATTLKTDAQRLIADADKTIIALRRTIDQVGEDAQQTVRNASQATGDIRNAATSFARLAAQLDRLVGENRQPVREFANNGLYELSQFLIDARGFVGNMNRILNQFERDPARFLFGDQAKGYEAK